jgi:hypothetical protein
MRQFEDAIHLIDYGKVSIEKIEISYVESLNDKQIRPYLLIKIKNFMENLRSALDYTANGLYAKYGKEPRKRKEISFPYALQTVNAIDFRRKQLIKEKIPGLTGNRPDIAKKIESYQHFSNSDNVWLPKFMSLNNSNKHQELTPQTKFENRELITTLSNGSKIILGHGARLIKGEVTYNVDNPMPFEGAVHEVNVWSSFNFSSNNEPVLPLLKIALTGAEKIVLELSEL